MTEKLKVFGEELAGEVVRLRRSGLSFRLMAKAQRIIKWRSKVPSWHLNSLLVWTMIRRSRLVRPFSFTERGTLSVVA
ncbi:MAG: hypothetical protein AAB682_02255 [Patescibacteria group bacterium]